MGMLLFLQKVQAKSFVHQVVIMMHHLETWMSVQIFITVHPLHDEIFQSGPKQNKKKPEKYLTRYKKWPYTWCSRLFLVHSRP